MSLFEVELEGVEELERDWQDAQRTLSDGLRKGVADAVSEGATEARATHRWKNRTGEAERQTKGVVLIATHGAAVGEIVCGVPYASFLSNGTQDHDVPARPGRWLAWENPDAQGDWHFARKVHVRGLQPDPFMANAYLKAERVIVREVETSAETAARIMDR